MVKTKYMVISKPSHTAEHLYAGEDRLERISFYNYLGTNLNNTAYYYLEIKTVSSHNVSGLWSSEVEC